MSTNVQKLQDEPIVVVSLGADYDVLSELPKAVPGYLKLLDTLDEPVVWIVDLSQVVLDIEGITIGANMLARSENPLYHHPQILRVIYVTASPVIQAAVRGMTSQTFGHVKISATDTLDDALVEARNGA